MIHDLVNLSVFVAKPLIVLVFLIVAIRLLGKRSAAQMNVYDLAMIVALANAVQNAMTEGKGDLAVGIAASGTLILTAAAITWFVARSPRAGRLLVGSPTVVLSNGRVLRTRLKRQYLTEEELMAALRGHGLRDPSEAQLAVLEVDGSLSIVPKIDAK
ncbi:MAG TPA: YetF domain-containing protein [Fimbriimonadaceae bacterium]|nr:YetF domain-containing protein [Fimbriimonadaceae bacterium]